MARISVLSFFSGGGFLDLGFEQAGFDVAWSNENDPAFADMYEYGISAWRKSLGRRPQLAKVSNRKGIEDLKPASVLREAFGNALPSVFGVIGGPPCPDFSNGGTHNGHRGENGKLTKNFVDAICGIQPHFFLIENVAGLYHFQKHRAFLERQIDTLRTIGNYAVDFKILNALELGVPQYRERLFVIGVRKKIANGALGRRLGGAEVGWFPWPHDPRYADARSLKWPGPSKFGRKPRLPSDVPLELTVYSALTSNGDPEKIENGRDLFEPYSDKFWTRDEGDVSGKSFKRLHRYRYSPTAWYGNQEVHLHPWKPRRLSVREALRIQSVPDAYVLPEGYSLSAKFKLVGNGVPCRMAELLGIQLHNFISQGQKASLRR